MDLQSLGDWIYGTPLSSAIRATTWIVPVLQSLHILAIATVVGSALVLELRVARVLATDLEVGLAAKRYLPWFWRALAVLLLTGSLLIVGEPGRTLSNRSFWIKMTLVAIGAGATLAWRNPLSRPAGQGQPPPARALAWALLALWVAVIFCGRWIAYTL